MSYFNKPILSASFVSVSDMLGRRDMGEAFGDEDQAMDELAPSRAEDEDQAIADLAPSRAEAEIFEFEGWEEEDSEDSMDEDEAAIASPLSQEEAQAFQRIEQEQREKDRVVQAREDEMRALSSHTEVDHSDKVPNRFESKDEQKAELHPSTSHTEANHQDKVLDRFENLVMDIECPISHLPLYQAVTLTPCGDKVNQVVAVARFGPLRKDGALSGSPVCPTCNKTVEAYFPDPKIRSLAKEITSARREQLGKGQKYQNVMLALAANMVMRDSENGLKIASLPPIEWVSKKLYEEILCPVTHAPLTSAMTLIPCCDKISKEALDDTVKQGPELCCPFCHSKVTMYLPDEKMRSLAMRVINASEEARRTELQNTQLLHDLALQKAEANDDATARLIANAITDKDVQEQTLNQVEQIVSTIRVGVVKRLANEGEYEEAYRMAVGIIPSGQKVQAINYVSEAEQGAKIADKEAARVARAAALKENEPHKPPPQKDCKMQ